MTGAPVIVLGAMTRFPVSGIVWLTMQYVLGFRRLGYDCYYVESHGGTPRPFVAGGDDGSAGAAAFLSRLMRRFDMADRWAFETVGSERKCYGLSDAALQRLYASAALIVNLHGATMPRPEHAAGGRLVYVGTDPVLLEVQLHQGSAGAASLLEPHVAFFTWATNQGQSDCRLPCPAGFAFQPTRQPLLLDLWTARPSGPAARFTTIAGWRQLWREIEFEGEVYHWSKHFEFLKVLALPSRCRADLEFELALSSFDDSDRALLEAHGWHVLDAAAVSHDLDAYRDYICTSGGEFTVAKDQNVRLRTGWFSDRSAAYLAAGCPVVTQDTGFGSALPTGCGLFAFTGVDDAAAAIETIAGDYDRHSAAARSIAADYFDHATVLPALLNACGV